MYSKSSCFLSPRKWWQRSEEEEYEDDTRNLCDSPDDRTNNDRDAMEEVEDDTTDNEC